MRHRITSRTYRVVSLAAGLALLLGACRQPSAPTPTPVPPATATPAVVDDLSKVRASGVLQIGTSLDYRPFDYYNPQGQPDGFDMALIREIAQLMGVRPQINDFAFDSIPTALQIGQVDVAIAAISVTPERQASFDFSNIYFYGEDAAVASSSSTIPTLTSPDQLAAYRLGVQTGSVYDTWVQQNLVKTGKMPATSVSQYTRMDQAFSDARTGRIDIALSDSAPATNAVAAGGLRIVGRSLVPQLFGIMVRKGSNLVPELNTALLRLQTSGRIAALAQQYLGTPPGTLPTVQPPPPTPTGVAPTPPSCVDGLSWVADLSYNDNNMTTPPQVPPGQPFTKAWRVLNSGTCTWTTGYRLQYVGGNVPAAQMGGQPVFVQRNVAPGETYDIAVNLVAPLTPGVYQGFWQMFNTLSIAFGTRIWVGISVPGVPTSTPVPPPPPSGSINFYADRYQVTAGERAVLFWSVSNSPTAVFVYAVGEPWQANPAPNSGQKDVYPQVSTTYEVRAQFRDGSVQLKQLRIEVSAPPPGAPSIDQFSVYPQGEIKRGQCVQVQWAVSGSVTRVRIKRNLDIIYDNAPTRGQLSNCPPDVGAYTYAVEASGPGGSRFASQTIFVVEGVAATPIPTLGPGQPYIVSFAVNPTTIQTGQCVNITWQVSGGTTVVRLKLNGNIVLDNAPFVGQTSQCLNLAGSYVYTLEAYGPGGLGDSRSITVMVGSGTSQPVNPLLHLWALVSLRSGSIMVPTVAGTNPDLGFYATGQAQGTTGCNTFSAPFTSSGSSIAIGTITSQGRFCETPVGVMQQEQMYFSLLRSATIYSVSGSRLTLYSAPGVAVLEFTLVK